MSKSPASVVVPSCPFSIWFEPSLFLDCFGRSQLEHLLCKVEDMPREDSIMVVLQPHFQARVLHPKQLLPSSKSILRMCDQDRSLTLAFIYIYICILGEFPLTQKWVFSGSRPNTSKPRDHLTVSERFGSFWRINRSDQPTVQVNRFGRSVWI